MKGTVEDWATESLLAAREAYQDPRTGKRIQSTTKLRQGYYDANLPVVRHSGDTRVPGTPICRWD